MRKATLRRNGKKMMSVQVTHVMSEDDMVSVIASMIIEEYAVGEPSCGSEARDAKITRKQVEKEMLEILMGNTESRMEYWSDSVGLATQGEIITRAEAIISREFPDFELTESEQKHMDSK